jgi:hypothetical protein
MLRESTICLWCLNPSTARIGLDKKGRPFVHCVGCGARCFLPSFAPCLNGVALLAPLARAIVDEMSTSREAYERAQQQVALLLAELRARVPGMTAPAPTAPSVPLPFARPA